jgi:hypothetical protein
MSVTSIQKQSEFVNTLGHEMIHLYQLQNCNDTGNHNASLFYSLKPRLKAIGLGTNLITDERLYNAKCETKIKRTRPLSKGRLLILYLTR